MDESNENNRDDEDDKAGCQQLSQCIANYFYGSIIIPITLYCIEEAVAAEQEKRYQRRSPPLFDQRLAWNIFCSRHSHRSDFDRHIRMSYASFNKLLTLIRLDLLVNNEMAELRGGAILPELCLYVCL